MGGQDGQEAEDAYNKKNDRLDARREKADEQRAQGKEPKDVPSKVTYTGRKDSDIFKAGKQIAHKRELLITRLEQVTNQAQRFRK